MARQNGEFQHSLRLMQDRNREQRQESLSIQELQGGMAVGHLLSVGRDLRHSDLRAAQSSRDHRQMAGPDLSSSLL